MFEGPCGLKFYGNITAFLLPFLEKLPCNHFQQIIVLVTVESTVFIYVCVKLVLIF
jgi:hypothetical protein